MMRQDAQEVRALINESIVENERDDDAPHDDGDSDKGGRKGGTAVAKSPFLLLAEHVIQSTKYVPQDYYM